MGMILTLGFITLITSIIAGVIGFGGGMLLIAILPLFLSPSIIIPIHGITQIASNASRMFFSLSDVQWHLFPAFLIGSVLGTIVFSLALFNIPLQFLPVAIACYLLLNLWSKTFGAFIKKFESYYLIGFLQTGLGLIVGAPGPLALSVLTKELESNDQIISTSAMFMTISHLAKIPVYLAITPFLSDSLLLISVMIVCAIVGSFLGTKLRIKADNDKIILLIKIALSSLAVHMLASSLVGQIMPLDLPTYR
ncbi:hypothetical protein A3762_12385 [Oleiphilus sp. HI0125]|uniref:sulfite exporter TauE/SafE family protein n=2 Tax=Oleiphilus sp. HI0125 TaxID=1822266 RepID=UPI0007C3B5A0|nr:sulfite exporter TauE/SafE family protein [Oleiphilus sp. HI0125]KZZ63387.1 hypothetical protein A3762_12385 [Oleiphilus sp. HI0125]